MELPSTTQLMEAPPGLPVPDFGGAYVSVDVEGINIWANNVTGIFYRSTDNGATWVLGFLPNSPYQIQDMDFLMRTLDTQWVGVVKPIEVMTEVLPGKILPTPNTDDQLTDLYLVGPNEFWVSTNSNKAYYSANGGQGWAVMDHRLNWIWKFFSYHRKL
ncbi:MAG: hypothetical protein MZV64_24760 [Ignavibacteriales bacterium]|nr:hypothetical protein [Ignavibacteriales bacterium]